MLNEIQIYNKMRHLLLLFWLFASLSILTAQGRGGLAAVQDDLSGLRAANDAAIKTMSPNRGLIEPSKLNPRQADLQKIYYNIDYKEGLLSMTTGDLLKAKLRYRLFGQLMEIEYQGSTYAMDLNMVKAFTIGQDDFILLPDPLKKKMGRIIHQVHFANANTLILQQHWTEEDFREKLNNVPTADSQLLRRSDDLLLVLAGEVHHILSHKAAMEALKIDKKSNTAKFIKASKLKLREAKDLVQLINYLNAEEGK